MATREVLERTEQGGCDWRAPRSLTAAELDRVTGGKGGGGGDSDGSYYESAIAFDGYYQRTAYGT